MPPFLCPLSPNPPFPLHDVELLGLFIRCQVQRALRVHPPLHFCWASDLAFFFLRPFLLTRAGVFFWGRWNSRRGARFDTGGAPVPAFRKLSMRHFIEVD